MPEEGVDLTPNEKILSSEEIIKVAKLFVEAGITKIRFTGGEPTVRKDLEYIISETSKLRSMGLKTIAMTTNGIVLARKLEKLVESGLNHVNISLDTLDPWKFQFITRRPGHDRVVGAIEKALALGMTT